jgi:ABC-type cobalamin/Fe3+-siderophores transport system ATPase subunit
MLKAGRVVRDGPTEEVLTAAALSDLFGTPVSLVRRDGYYHVW